MVIYLSNNENTKRHAMQCIGEQRGREALSNHNALLRYCSSLLSVTTV
jgi:hypothetical protein